MDTYDEDTGAFSWSLQERRHIAQSFKQRSLATLPLRFSGTSTAAAPPVTPTHRRSLQHHGASFLSRHGGEKARSQVTFCTLAFAILGSSRCRYIDASTDQTLQPVTTYMCEDTAQLLTAERMRSYLPVGDQVGLYLGFALCS